MSLRVTLYGEPVLQQPGETVTHFGPELAEFARQMVETMYQAEGIGLAAQQVGRAVRLAVVDLQTRGTEAKINVELDGRRAPAELLMPLHLVNPVVRPIGGETEPFEEGCLSFPGIRGDVVRPTTVEVEYQDLDGARHLLRCDGLLARCIQHEADHLDGVLFLDRMTRAARRTVDTEAKKLKAEVKEALRAGQTPVVVRRRRGDNAD